MQSLRALGTATGRDTLRRLIPQGWKSAAVGVLCSKVVGEGLRRAFAGKIPHHGHKIFVDPRLVSPRTVAMIYLGIYERAEVDLVKRFLPAEYDVIEFGASLGVNSCNIASKLSSGRRVVSVEADPELVTLATRTVALNGYQDRVTVLNAAIDYSGASSISLYKGEDTLSATILGPRGAANEAFEVETLTLRKILDDYQIDDYSLVADIEGAELAVLMNDREALKRCRAIIIEIEACEYRGERFSHDRIRDMIIGLGFVEAYAFGPCSAFLRDGTAPALG